MSPLGVGILGCGNIAPIYLQNTKRFSNLRLVGCADVAAERAKSRAEEFGTTAYSVDALLNHPEIQIIVNLTVPKAHASMSLEAIRAGKHVYLEKPLGLTRVEGTSILESAKAEGLLVGCAPDTFLGAGLQTCRDLIDEGAIGRPVAATAFMLGDGPEGWHPDPEFFFEVGGGPMLDMGPYFLAALVHLLGPVTGVAGASCRAYEERVVGSGPKKGKKFPVEIDTHLAGVLRFASGVVGTLVTSFDVCATEVPCIEIYGTEGTLSVPDPNSFGGPVRLFSSGRWQEVEITRAYAENSRGLGVADLASAILHGRVPRASGSLAYHVLDVMLAFHELGPGGANLEIQYKAARPDPLPKTLADWDID